MTRLTRHLRSNIVAYLALFVALGGTSYAAIRIPTGSVGTRQLKNHSITPIKFNSSKIAASIRYWAVVDGSGHVLASSKPRPATYGFAAGNPGIGTVNFGKPRVSGCYPIATVNGLTSGFVSVSSVGIAEDLQTYDPDGRLAPKTVDLAVFCPNG